MENIDILSKCDLFYHVPQDEIEDFIRTYPCRTVQYKKGEEIIVKGDLSAHLAIVLEGSIGVYSDSEYGDHTLIGIGDRHYMFGFTAHFYNNLNSIASLTAREKTTVAYFRMDPRLTANEFIGTLPVQIISNLYMILTHHIRSDFDRMYIISSSSIRQKLSRYLMHLSREAESDTFTLPFSKTELANYLGLYRTSLQRGLANLQKAGIIRYNRNEVTITDKAGLYGLINESET